MNLMFEAFELVFYDIFVKLAKRILRVLVFVIK